MNLKIILYYFNQFSKLSYNMHCVIASEGIPPKVIIAILKKS